MKKDKEESLSDKKQKVYDKWAYHGLSVVDMINKCKKLDKEAVQRLIEVIENALIPDDMVAHGYLLSELNKIFGDKLTKWKKSYQE